jgi:hypothetical protein
MPIESPTALLLTAAPTWLSTTPRALGIAAFVSSSAALIVSIVDVPVPRVTALRFNSTLLSGALVATSAPHWLPGWALALCCLGVIAGLQALAIEFGRVNPLRAHSERP